MKNELGKLKETEEQRNALRAYATGIVLPAYSLDWTPKGAKMDENAIQLAIRDIQGYMPEIPEGLIRHVIAIYLESGTTPVSKILQGIWSAYCRYADGDEVLY